MRSSFPVRQARKTAFSASYLIPIYCEEVLPGDTFNITCNAVVRTAVPIVPILDNWHMEFFAFFTPNRILWTNWQKFLGAQDNPGDSTLHNPAGTMQPERRIRRGLTLRLLRTANRRPIRSRKRTLTQCTTNPRLLQNLERMVSRREPTK